MDADDVPAVVVYQDGTEVDVLPTVTNLSAGRYEFTYLTATGFTNGDNVREEVYAVVNGYPMLGIIEWRVDDTVSSRLAPTTAGRTLDVTATGAAGIDWGNVENETTTNALTNTTVATTQQVDLNTIKTKGITCGAAVTIYAYLGTAAADTAQTGDAFARLGAPVGASISADIASLKTVADTVAGDVAGLDGAAMRGTDGANTVVPDAAGTAASLLTALQSHGDTSWATATGFSTHAPSDVAALILATPANKLVTDASGFVTYANAAPPTAAAIRSEIDTNSTQLAAILADTGTDGVVVALASKTGYSLAATGLDAIPITAPTGVAGTFREMLVATWRRFFKKATLSTTQLKTYADNGTTVLTTQTVADTGGTQTIEDAS